MPCLPETVLQPCAHAQCAVVHRAGRDLWVIAEALHDLGALHEAQAAVQAQQRSAPQALGQQVQRPAKGAEDDSLCGRWLRQPLGSCCLSVCCILPAAHILAVHASEHLLLRLPAESTLSSRPGPTRLDFAQAVGVGRPALACVPAGLPLRPSRCKHRLCGSSAPSPTALGSRRSACSPQRRAWPGAAGARPQRPACWRRQRRPGPLLRLALPAAQRAPLPSPPPQHLLRHSQALTVPAMGCCSWPQAHAAA